MLTFLTLLLGKLKNMPWQVWLAIGLFVLVGVGACVHGKQVKTHDKQVIAKNDKLWQDKLDKAHLEALSWKNQVEKKQDQINSILAEKHNAETTRIAAVADNERLLGPGAASCRQRNNSSLSGPTDPTHTTTSTDASRPPVPAVDLAAVPWPWLVTRAQQFDQCQSDLKTMFDWADQQKVNFGG